MNNEKIEVLILKSDDVTPNLASIKNNLNSLQDVVGGNIETIDIGSEVIIICNEEGKLLNLETNLALYTDVDGKVADYIAGDCIFASYDYKGEIKSLTKDQMNFAAAFIIRNKLLNESIKKKGG